MAQTGEVRPDKGRVHQIRPAQINPHPRIVRSPCVPHRHAFFQYVEMPLVGHLSSVFVVAGIHLMINPRALAAYVAPC